MSEPNYNNFEQLDFDALSEEEKRQALRNLTELTDHHLTQQVLAIGMKIWCASKPDVPLVWYAPLIFWMESCMLPRSLFVTQTKMRMYKTTPCKL
ncbi:hypothetical protein ABEW19_16980 [Paenibacillus illinoisensis]|uniref:hypothetical protein n=1 Tax=Paenibacillus illinoisensis TaxID=59845 RepID=UPI003D2970B1